MPDDTKLSPGSVGLSAGLSVLALLFYALQVATLADLAGSDAAGNAYAQAYGAVEIIFLWAVLAVLMLIAFHKGAVPKPAVLAAVILVPASGVVAFTALDLLSKPYLSPFRWPLVLPVLMPPLIVAYCFWALLPALRAKFPAHVTAGVIWGAVLTLCVAIVPLQQMREHALDVIDQELTKYDEDYAKLATDAPLKDWLPFLETRNETKKNEVLGRMRKLERRQSEAELMLDRGDFPLRYLGSLNLTPTASICDKARALLRRRVEPLVLKTSEPKPYREIGGQVSDALAAMKWLVGYECSCDAESLAWETMAKTYRDINYDVYELAELRDPKNFGRIVRMYPERYSMLTPRAHLKVWLTYADKKEFHDQALAGARKLDHRTADAVEMLNDKYDIAAPWQVLKYLPVLDLEMTPRLCGAALTHVHGDFAKVLRPKPDDPRRYSELLDRLGAYEPLTALVWLAGHGCDAEGELSEAEAVIRIYQDSPARVAMLATLAQLHRKN
jgi:hypothetical protein